MNKFIIAVLNVLIIFNFFGCESLRAIFAEKAGLAFIQAVMVDPVYEENGDLLTCSYDLHWNRREYEEFGFADSEDIGKLFGLTDMSGSDRVFLAVGQKPEDWLIWNVGEPMGAYVLCKEKNVTEIPAGYAGFGDG